MMVSFSRLRNMVVSSDAGVCTRRRLEPSSLSSPLFLQSPCAKPGFFCKETVGFPPRNCSAPPNVDLLNFVYRHRAIPPFCSPARVFLRSLLSYSISCCLPPGRLRRVPCAVPSLCPSGEPSSGWLTVSFHTSSLFFSPHKPFKSFFSLTL